MKLGNSRISIKVSVSVALNLFSTLKPGLNLIDVLGEE